MKIVVLFENHAILSLVGTMTAAVAVICTLQTLLNLAKGVVEALIKAICLKADLSFCPPTCYFAFGPSQIFFILAF